MTNGERLTLAQLAGAVGMTARNVRAYQTRGLLQAPHRVGRGSMYDGEHVRRLLQVQRARARGASLALLQTLIREGRDLDGVWSPDLPPHGAAGQPRDPSRDTAGDGPADGLIDLTDAAGGHTPDCLARREVPLTPLLAHLHTDAGSELADAIRVLVDVGVFVRSGDEVRVPGSFACAVTALHEQGQVAAAAAVRLGAAVGEAAGAVVQLVARSARTLEDDARPAAADRLAELTAAVVGQLAGREALVVRRTASPGEAVHSSNGDRRPAPSLTER